MAEAELPPGWAWATLGDLIEGIDSGKNVSALGRPPGDGEVGIVKVSAVTWGEFDEEASKTLHPGTTFDPEDRILPGDFLISRANTLELVGAPVIVRSCRRNLVLSDKILRLRFKLKTDRWIELFLKSVLGRQQIEGFSQGAQLSMRNISQENLLRVRVPLAPSAESARILVVVNETLESLDEAEAALARAREGVERFRASLLHAACTGQLTAAWRRANPPAETGADLLRRILAERRAAWERTEHARLTAKGTPPRGDAWKARYEEPAAPEVTGLPELPDGWTWATIDHLIRESPRNGVSVQGSAHPPGTAALRLDALGDDGLRFDRRRYIEISDTKATALFIAKDDFLVSRANGSPAFLARACVAAKPPDDVVFPDTMIRFRFHRYARPAWLYHVWKSDFLRIQILKKAKTSAGILKVSQDDLLALRVPLPPIDEQDEGVSAIGNLMSSANGLDGVADAGAGSTLRQSILHAAFTGKLVPQDPADEPAAVLLARLRENAAPARRTRRMNAGAQA